MAGDETHTLKTLVDAAQRGDAAAQFELGRRYYRGEGTPLNGMIAMRWFRCAADQGHVVAKIYLAELAGEDALPDEPALQRWLHDGSRAAPLAPPPLPGAAAPAHNALMLRPDIWRRAAVPAFVAGLGLAVALLLLWWQEGLPGLF